MKITFERWCAIAFLGCLALGVAILPADSGTPFANWFSTPERTRVQDWQRRMYARQNHENSVLDAYAATRDLILAREQFGATQGKVGEPDVRFASDIPTAMRAEFMRALGVERAERGEWTGRGKVGLIVRLDTATRINGHVVKRLADRYGTTLSRTIAPSAATGDRCVVVIDIPRGDGWFLFNRDRKIRTPRPLMDACGFYDAFGMPGAEIGRDLAETRFNFARGYPWVSAPDTVKHPYRYSFQRWYLDASVFQCMAGNDTACIVNLRGARPPSYYYPSVTLPAGVTHVRYLARELPAPTELNRMVLEVGPQRFARIWQSPKSLDQAYADETGKTLGQFVRELAVHNLGAYRAGPWTPAVTSFMTLLAIAVALVLAMKFARRPRVA